MVEADLPSRVPVRRRAFARDRDGKSNAAPISRSGVFFGRSSQFVRKARSDAMNYAARPVPDSTAKQAVLR
ncbi:MAG TPA: hypothetical protein VFW15_16785, partial [Thermoanaerobaculia bacterium]|nr:hypothetical protein [Thermoanaerobaculia bacterium]